MGDRPRMIFAILWKVKSKLNQEKKNASNEKKYFRSEFNKRDRQKHI